MSARTYIADDPGVGKIKHEHFTKEQFHDMEEVLLVFET